MKDEEEVKQLLRQQKNKWKKDTKAIKQGTATLQDMIVEEPKPKQMKVNLTFWLARAQMKYRQIAAKELEEAPSEPYINLKQQRNVENCINNLFCL